MAYILVNSNDKYIVALEKTTVAYIIGVHRHTITNIINRLDENQNSFKKNGYTVIIADEYYGETKSRGNKLSMSERKQE